MIAPAPVWWRVRKSDDSAKNDAGVGVLGGDISTANGNGNCRQHPGEEIRFGLIIYPIYPLTGSPM
jgi:hypothetical protein